MTNDQNNGRRKFIIDSAKATALVIVGSSAAGAVLQSCAGTNKVTMPSGMKTGFDQTPLPYAYDALENIIDARTMEIHYTKHAAAYSKAVKEAVQAEASAMTSVEELLSNISKYSVKMRNNAGGHYNHEMFWKSMRPKTLDNKPSGNLMTAIESAFGSFAAFKTQFADAAKARFGSGWAWLYRDTSGKLKIGSTPNQDNPLMNVSEIKGFPVLGLDVWEHAYYLKYQNKRADYIEGFWNVVNWNYIGERFSTV